MKSLISIVLVFHLSVATVWPTMDSPALFKLKFLVTHSWEHLAHDGFSIVELVSHYIHHWNSEDHQPTPQQQNIPSGGSSWSYCLQFVPVSIHTFNLNLPANTRQKYFPYLFALTSGYYNKIFHPPKP